MFGTFNTSTQPASSWLTGNHSALTGVSTGLGREDPTTKSGFVMNCGESCGLSTSTGNNVQPLISRDRKFLPGRPSLHDILSVAPHWKEAFETLCKSLALRDSQIRQLENLTQDLKEKNEVQKNLIKEGVKTACSDLIAQDFLCSEIENQQPIVRKWRRQVNTLSTSFQRTFGSNKITGQPLIIPQSEYLRFIDDIQKRFQKIEKRALSVEQMTILMRQELQGETLPLDIVLKNILTGLMNQYKILKYTYVGLHEELKSAIERYKYSHPHSTDLDQQLDDGLNADGNVYLAMLMSTSKPPTRSLKAQTLKSMDTSSKSDL